MTNKLPENIEEEPTENLIVPIEQEDTLVFTLENGQEFTISFDD